jgi:hypothetical protein
MAPAPVRRSFDLMAIGIVLMDGCHHSKIVANAR